MSRGTPASENQSLCQTTIEHKGVNDKQMKGRISDTCSLPLFLCLPPSPTCISFLVTAPSLLACFFQCMGLTEVDADGVRFSRSYKHRDAPSFCLSLLSFLLPVSSSHTAQNDNESHAVYCAGTGCLPGSLPDTWNRLCTCLPVCLSSSLSVLAASELAYHSVQLSV